LGRKTGVTLRETDVRDEHGMEPLDVFSSPMKNGGASSSDSGEMEMDIENSMRRPLRFPSSLPCSTSRFPNVCPTNQFTSF
jgi:hypothetical protein